MTSQLRPALMLFFLLTILTGFLYPLVVTTVAQTVFSDQANGSLISVGGRNLGSELIGQPFDDPRYFWGRPSATGYNAASSSGSNLGPNNPALVNMVRARIDALKAADPTVESDKTQAPIPADLVTASGSGLDPHISVASAYYQVSRIAKARGLDESVVRMLVAQFIEPRQFFILGEPRVNVLKLNLALDALK